MQPNFVTRPVSERPAPPERRKLKSARVVVIFSEDAIDWLNEQSQRYNTSVADVLRRMVDETRGAYLVGPKR